jgi:hypothetical protein
MTAAGTAAQLGQGLPMLPALAIAILGGLVEGTALGILQANWLGRRFDGFPRRRWIAATIVVAGVGWAAASAPSAFGDGDGAAPGWAFVGVAAAGLGLAMGAILGAAQAWAIRGSVRHPWRWTGISAVAWTPTMAIIFVGATLPDAHWQTASVILTAALTGAVAGLVLGAITHPLMAALNGPSISSAVVAWGLRRRVPGLGASFALLRVTGRRTGRVFEFPVQYARQGDVVAVLPARPERKNWWRNLQTRSRLVIWLDGEWRRGDAVVVREGSRDYEEAHAVYAKRWPSAARARAAMFVRIVLGRSEA